MVSKNFISLWHLLLNPLMPPSTLTLYVACILLYLKTMVRSACKKQLSSSNLLHDKHLFAHVAWVPKQIFKIIICMGKMVTLIDVNVKMSQYCHIMIWPWVSTINVDENILMIDNDHVVHWIIYFSIHWTKSSVPYYSMVCESHQVSINELDVTWKSQILLANVPLYSIVGRRISFTIASLLHKEMKIVSLHTKNLKQFHMNASCMVTLSCSTYRMKFKRCCSSVNFNGQLENHTMFYMVENSWHD